MTLLERFTQAKESNPTAVILIKSGAFFETLDADARLVHEVAGIALTRKAYYGKDHVLAGVPYHDVYRVAQALTDDGHKFSIVE